jgi:epoxyqueuosine reductase
MSDPAASAGQAASAGAADPAAAAKAAKAAKADKAAEGAGSAGGPGSSAMAALRDFFAGSAVLEWGVAPARESPHAENLRAWVDRGYHASMEYMARRLAERADPTAFHPWARSAVVFSFPYGAPLGTSRGPYRVAAYAHGGDYHDRARVLLRGAEAALRAVPGLEDVRFYAFADTAPVFERDLASEAGLGWRGKNGCTLSRTRGSAFHLAGFFLDLELPASVPVQEFCGGCTRCLDLCPTGAFAGPGVLDANKCISYWTIEARAAAPPELAAEFGGWIFGCDVCQEVCPWNHKHLAKAAPPREEGPAGPEVRPEELPADASSWLALLKQGGGFRSRSKGTPLTRAGRRGLLRNLAIAIRNLRDTSAREPLEALLAGETDEGLRTELRRTLEALSREA